tara:strand:+ start:650 stop:895 length:246 start_codon:yes stop_codon:yes gene_type:complete
MSKKPPKSLWDLARDGDVEAQERCRIRLAQTNIRIEDEHGGFAIEVNGERFKFDDDDGDHKGLVAVFKALGIEKVEYEEVY